MKYIFKKLHFGSNHDPSRSNEIPSTSSPSPSSSCGSDHRQSSSTPPAITTSQSSSTPPPIISPTTPSPTDVGVRTQSASSADMSDYFSSEEEFQVQLALAISASNSEFREDPHNDQIRAATLLSLGKHRIDPVREEEGTAESLSRRYWDYNVLDYDEKVVDGFYDIFGLSTNPAGHGKIPSLADLQTNIGDLGFEVIIINREIDLALVELEQVAHCIALDCPAAEVGLLVQMISDLVTEHMGGPVRDANDMLARWMERSTELRTSLQTSLLPIGGMDVGLSRHRALLFKILADNVGIPCRLVKGSHYTGLDEDAVNIIKLGNEREFLVDLMAAPGTLIPADVLSTKDASLSSNNPRLSPNLTPWAANDSGIGLSRMESFYGEYKGEIGNSIAENNGVLDRNSRSEKAVPVPSAPNANSVSLPTCSGSSSNGNMKGLAPTPDDHSYQLSSTSVTSHQQEGVLQVPVGIEVGKERASSESHSQDTVDSSNLFAELNPFQVIGVGKSSSQLKATENKVNDFQRRRENITSGPGRPPLPLVWKNRSACNEVPNNKQYNFVEGLFPQKNVDAKNYSGSSSSSPSSLAAPGKIFNEVPKINVAGASSGNSVFRLSGSNDLNFAMKTNQCSDTAQSSEKKHQDEDHMHGMVLQNSMENGLKVQRRNVNEKHGRRKCTHDRFMGTDLILKDPGSSSTPANGKPNSLDPMLEDVAEWELPWEDLVIGERIGLGSYGEVYHADWNGTEVAVKKFLDQDFSGDALDEFRSEVRIMRRLRHPNVVLFMGAVTRPPNLSIVTEFLPRGSLYRILHRPNCQIDEKRRIRMALDVAKGMNCLHTSTPTIVHRDLKSPNLLVDKNWNVKVCDFGLSRLKHNTFLSSKSTAGTPEWMAPEVLRNEPSNEKCDVYSFGIILWELATLRMPWSGMNPMQVVGAVGFQNRRLDIPKEVDPLVARIIWECWQTDPSLRPSFAQLTSALKPLQQLVIHSHLDAQGPPVTQEISVNSTP